MRIANAQGLAVSKRALRRSDRVQHIWLVGYQKETGSDFGAGKGYAEGQGHTESASQGFGYVQPDICLHMRASMRSTW